MDVIQALLDFPEDQRGPIDFNLKDNAGQTPFFWACAHRRLEVVETLVNDNRILVNARNEQKYSPLWWASWKGDVAVVKVLLASARKINTKKASLIGETPLDAARDRGAEDAKRDDDGESEKTFQKRKTGCKVIESLLESYQKDPDAVREHLQTELENRKGTLSFDSFPVSLLLWNLFYCSSRFFPEPKKAPRKRFGTTAKATQTVLQTM